MKIVCISDTHNKHDRLIIPKCDVLIHCGDWTSRGSFYEVKSFTKWLNLQTQCKNIILIPGNHELDFEKQLPASLEWIKEDCPKVHLLIDQEVIIENIKFYGSPVQPWFCNWAWNRASGISAYNMHNKTYYPKSIKPHWDAIPEDTNILITHGPPFGILDQTIYANGDLRPEHLGCPLLMKRIKQLKQLDLHFFGHIHNPGGTQVHKDGISYFNCSICDEAYYPSNSITIVEYVKE